jgi:hypothetical protein
MLMTPRETTKEGPLCHIKCLIQTLVSNTNSTTLVSSGQLFSPDATRHAFTPLKGEVKDPRLREDFPITLNLYHSILDALNRLLFLGYLNIRPGHFSTPLNKIRKPSFELHYKNTST